MRVALCQFNPLIGAISQNAERILAFAKQASEKGAQLLILPELAICGYPPQDLLFRQELLDQIEEHLLEIARHAPIPVLVGAPVRHHQPNENPLWNAAVLCTKGQVKVIGKKALLPNYDVFDEKRYFEPKGQKDEQGIMELGGVIFGVTICEDAWNDPQFWPHQRYQENPVEEVVGQGAQIILNLSASPYSRKKPLLREQVFSHLAKKHQRTLIMVGQVGANDQLIFDGSSVAIDEDGQVMARAPVFEEALLLVDIGVKAKEKARPFPNEMEMLSLALITGIRDYVQKCRSPGAIVGLSGGIDSAVTAALAVRALGPERVLGVRMPSKFSSNHSLEDAEELANNLGIKLHTVPIEPMVASFRNALSAPLAGFATHTDDVTDQNLQARARGMVLMAFSNKTDYLVLTTGNKSETSVGYSTLYGDMCGALGPLSDIYKTDVYRLAHHFNTNGPSIPERSITKPASAELKENQTDQDTLPPYDLLDAILSRYIDQEMPVRQIEQETQIPRKDLMRIISMVHRNEYKRRQAPFSLMVSERVFGMGRRWPIAKKFDPL